MHGLKLVAVAVVAQAVLGMARTLCPDRQRASIAVGAVVAVLLLPAAFGQVSAIAVGAIAGLVFCRKAREPVAEIELGWVAPRGLSLICLILFVVLFAPGGAWLQAGGPAALFHGLYRTGALVFGGGHVVLPLLRQQVVAPGWVSDSQFLAGYGAAQATPGPLFAFAAYLGAVSKVGGGPAGATIALIGIFLPGLLLMLAALPHWRGFRRHSAAQAAMQGVNASVVGILALALYDPVWIGAVHSNADFAIAAIGFILLVAWDAPPLLVVALSVAAAAMTAAI
jgi:chromate transporter